MSTFVCPLCPPAPPSKTCIPCGGGSTPLVGHSCPAGTYYGNSTLLTTGQFSFSQNLLSVNALGGTGWGTNLNYLSGTAADSTLGVGFNYQQNTYLTELVTGDVVATSGDNTQELFTDNGDGTYSSALNNTAAVLTRSGSGATDQFTLTSSGGNVTIFSGFDTGVVTPGRLKSITDRFGNSQTQAWADVGGMTQLQSVTDGYGRTTTYTYYGSEQNYMLRQITDPLGRQINFQFDGQSRLVSVVLPSINRGSAGNLFPDGTAYVFEYDTLNPRPERRNDLIRIWFPNQSTPFITPGTRTVNVAQVYTDAVPRYTVEYGQDPTDPDTYGKVVSETVGDPSPGSTVGGTYEYEYISDPSELPASIFYDSESPNPRDQIVKRTIVRDRNDNEHIYDFNSFDMPLRIETRTNRNKNSLQTPPGDGYVTWTRYNEQNQDLVVIRPAGDCTEYTYDDGMVDLGAGPVLYPKRRGLLNTVTRRPDNDYGIVGAVIADEPQAYWRLGETSGTTAADTSGNGLSATYTGGYTLGQPGAIVGDPNDAVLLNGASGYVNAANPSGLQITGNITLEAWVNVTAFPTSGNYAAIVSKGFNGSNTAYYLGLFNNSGTLQLIAGAATSLSIVNWNIAGWATDQWVYVTATYDGTNWNLSFNGVQVATAASATTPTSTTKNVYLGAYDNNGTAAHFLSGTLDEVAIHNAALSADRVLAHYNAGVSGLPQREGSNGQTRLTTRYFYDPIYNNQIAAIEPRGNPIDTAGTYFVPQNLGTTPTDADRSRYATITYLDYQKDQTSTVTGDADLQTMLGLDAAQILALINAVSAQISATDGTGGLPDGFEMNLGDINGDGTGDGASSGLPFATHLGQTVKVQSPSVRLVGGTSQERVELYTNNLQGQTTTYTDPEANITVYVRYPQNDPEGDGQLISATPGSSPTSQYGRVKEIHVDANPNEVMTLVGADGDLVDFVVDGVYPRDDRTNTPGSYLDLTTRYEPPPTPGTPGSASGGGCSTCSYDALGNILSQTDPRGFTTVFDRNELGEEFRRTSPAPYFFKVETQYDANRNVIRVDTEDKVVAYQSDDPTDATYAKFVPSGSVPGGVAHVPMLPGEGGAVRPGWFTNLMTYDLLDNKIQDDIDATGSMPASLVTSYAYDPNQNLIRTTKPMGNTVESDYDERDLPIAQRVGYDTASSQAGAVTVMVYDDNGNLVDTIGPTDRNAGVEGAATSLTATIADAFRMGMPLTHTGDWTSEVTYDGFDRAISTTDAIGNVSQSVYDPDGRGIQSTNLGPIGGTSPINRNGTDNVTLANSITRYDEAGRQYESQQDVFLATGTTLPSSRAVTHTGGGLAANSNANDHTGTVTLTSGGSSYVLSRTIYDRSGRTVQQLQDNTAATTMTYDGAGRTLTVTDALGNIVENEYDNNGNVVLSTRTEVCTITPVEGQVIPNEVFRSGSRYDCLNQLVLTAQSGADGDISTDPSVCCTWPVQAQAIFNLYGYDSRGNRTLMIDPKGNTTVTEVDGASRSIEVIQHLRQDGDGANPPCNGKTFLPSGESSGAIRTQTLYDANSRVIALIDDHGATTTYTYDTLDRQITMSFADGATRYSFYDAASDLLVYVNENNSTFTHTYDATGRRTATAIDKSTGVEGTDSQAFEYDGLSRRTSSNDHVDAGGGVDADCVSVYDSISRVLEDSQTYDGNTRNATNTAFTSLPVTGFTFPGGSGGGGGRQVTHTYDALYRRTQLEEGYGPPTSTIATWSFFGPSRVAEVTLGSGLIQTMMNNTRTHSAVQAGTPGVPNPSWGTAASDRLGYDGAGRMIAKRFLAGGVNEFTGAYNDTTPVVGFTTAFDPASNKYFERALHAESRSSLYQPAPGSDGTYSEGSGIDSVNRLRLYERGTLASSGGSGGGGGSVVTPITLPGTDSSRGYDLDHLGNWKNTPFRPVGGSSTLELRQHNKLNQITSRKVGSASTVPFSYDKNGNLLNDGVRIYTYDAFNRLLQVNRVSDSEVIGTYAYDASLARRVRKVVSNGGLSGDIPDGTTDYLYLPGTWQCCEERNASSPDDPTKQYAWGLYIDELVEQKTYIDTGSQPLAAGNYYPLANPMYCVLALTDNAGNIVEAYDLDPYGNRIVFSAPGTGINWWADDATQTDYSSCIIGHQGLVHDEETGLIYNRARMLHPALGRFLQTDPMQYGDSSNLYVIDQSNPIARNDPSGELSVVIVSVNPWANKAGVSVSFNFKLSAAATEGGFIVQEIIIENAESVCCSTYSLTPPIAHYWEAFPINAGSTAVSDSVTLGGSGGWPLHGEANQIGKIKYFKSTTIGGPINWPIGGASASGSLMSTTTQPAWWTTPADEGPATRQVYLWWHNCLGDWSGGGYVTGSEAGFHPF